MIFKLVIRIFCRWIDVRPSDVTIVVTFVRKFWDLFYNQAFSNFLFSVMCMDSLISKIRLAHCCNSLCIYSNFNGVLLFF